MAIIPDSVIEEIRSRTDIVQVIGDRISLKRGSGGFVACCPFHHENTPSFNVNVQRQRYHCFGCGEDGDVFKFLMQHDGMSFMDAVRYLAEKCGVQVTMGPGDASAARAKRLFQVNAEAASFFRRCLLSDSVPGAAAARAYLEKRRLSNETAEAFGIGFDPDIPGTIDAFARKNRFSVQEMIEAGIGTLSDRPGSQMRLRDRFHGRLMFPIKDQAGRVVAFSARILDAAKSPAKYVNSPETDVFKKSRILYALDKAQRPIAQSRNREAIICEGQIDVIRCHSCGFPRAVASEGTAFTPEHASLLHRYADSAVLLFDADGAGRKAAVRTAGILLAEGIPARVATMPDGEDPDSFLLSNPPERFQELLDAAEGIVQFQVRFLRSAERDPDGADAVARVVQGCLQTIAQCRNAIHKARMVQELAQQVRLPEQAIRDELAGVEEALRRQEESAVRREAAREEWARREQGRTQPGASSMRATPARSDGPPPDVPPPELFDDPADWEPPVEAAAPVSDGQASARGERPGASDTPPDALDVAMCEFLLNHSLEEPGTLHALSLFVPPSIIPNPLVRRIVEAFYGSVGASTDPVADLQEADPEVARFLGTVAARRDRTGTGENWQAADVAHDLALGAWRRHLQSRIDAAAGDSPDAMRARMSARAQIRALRSWETGEATVRLLAGVDSAVSSAPQSAPPAPESAPAPPPAPPDRDSSVPAPFAPPVQESSLPTPPSDYDDLVPPEDL